MPAKKAVKKTVKKKIPKKDLALGDFSRYFFILLMIAVFAAFLWVISPFFNVIVYSALIAVVFYPLRQFFAKRLWGRAGLAAFVTTLLAILLILVPLVLFIVFLSQEAVVAYQQFETYLSTVNFDVYRVGDQLNRIPWMEQVTPYIESMEIDLIQVLKDIASRVSGFIVDQGANIVVGFGDLMVQLLIMVLTVFYFLKDGEKISQLIKNLSPLPLDYEDEIEEKLKEATHAVVVGNFGTAFLQGMVGMLGLLIAPVENAVFWGTIMIFASLIPYVGASVIWGPIAVALAVQGHYAWSIFIVVWGMAVVATVDNLVRPMLVGGKAAMHPLSTFLVILGGFFVFGIHGIIFGPLILSLAVTMVHIYEQEYKEILRS